MARGLRSVVLVAAGSLLVSAFEEGDVAYTDGARNLELALGEMRAMQNGPPPPPEVKETNDTPLRLYDCDAEYYDWKHLWTPEWKKWCCEQHRKGCPGDVKTAPVEAETTLAEATTSMEKATAPNTKAATSASTTVAEATAKSTPAATTVAPSTGASTTVARTTRRETCDDMCVFEGKSYTCFDRMQWALKHRVQKQKWKCFVAHDMVVKQCPKCHRCPMDRGLEGTACERSDIQEKVEVAPSLRMQRRGVHWLSSSVGLTFVAMVGSVSALAFAWRRCARSIPRRAPYAEVTEPLQ